MSEWIAASMAAFWLGTLAAISPCPLATNVAAISYIGKDLESGRRVVLSGALYALGRVFAYIGVAVLVVSSVLSIPAVAMFLEMHLANIHRRIEDFKPHAVLFDPITNLMAVAGANEVKAMLTRLIDY